MSQEEIRIAGLPGDGIGPEIYPYGVAMLDAVNKVIGASRFRMETLPYNASYFLEHGRAWPDGTPEKLAGEFHGAFSIALGDARVPQGGMAHAVKIVLDGFRGHPAWKTNLNIRPSILLHPDLSPEIQQGPFDFQLYALNKNGESVEESMDGGIVITKEIHRTSAFMGTLRRAIMKAKERGERKVIVAHKNNVFRYSHGPWAAECKRIGEQEGIEIEMQLMDSFLERLLKNPRGVSPVVVTDRVFGAVLKRTFAALRKEERKNVPDDFSLTIGRENTEGMYFRGGSTHEEHGETIGTQIGKHSTPMIRANIKGNIALAREKGETELTVLHVNDVHPLGYGLWEKIAQEVGSEEHFDIRFMHAGDFVALLIENPEACSGKVFAADNVLGDICGDAAAALIGGLGIPSTDQVNTTGETGKHFWEPLHGSAPDIAGKGIANPTATFLTVGEIAGAYGHGDVKRNIQRAIQNVLAKGIRTQDLPKGKATTQQFGDAVIKNFLSL